MTDASTTGAVGVTRYAPYSDAPSGDGWMDYHPHGEWVRFTDYQAAIQREEAAEAATFRVVTERNAMEAALTARLDAEWNAGRDAAIARVQKERDNWFAKHGTSEIYGCYLDGLDDAMIVSRALRRAAPMEGEA